MAMGAIDIKYLPRVYHSILSRDVLNKVYSITGSYFPGAVPDMANAICSSYIVKKCIYIHAPIIISGYGYNSGAGMGARGDWGMSLDSKETIAKYHLSDEIIKKWDNNIPRIIDGYTLWTQATIDALHAMGYPLEQEKINFCALYAKSILKYRKVRKEYIMFAFNRKCLLKTLFEIIKFILKFSISKTKLFVMQSMGKVYNYDEKINLDIACKIVNEYVNNVFKAEVMK